MRHNITHHNPSQELFSIFLNHIPNTCEFVLNPIFAQKALTEMCATAIYSNWADIFLNFEINFFGGLKLHLITKDYNC